MKVFTYIMMVGALCCLFCYSKEKEDAPTGATFNKTFVTGYLTPESIVISKMNSGIKITFKGDLITSGRSFDALSIYYNDLSYNRYTIDGPRTAINDSIYKIEVYTVENFDASHPAGSDISDLIECAYLCTRMEQLEEKQPFDVIVIGAGAAGMMAAGTAARSGRRVLLIEKMEKSGRKVRITGKGRCNVTNARPAEEFADQVRTNAEFFKVAFSEFNNRAAIKFFERAGVKLDIERGDRVFPQSGKAWDIANALLEYCYENGVKIIYNTRVTEIMTLGDKVFGVRYINRRGFERKEECPQVIVATGGVSYPATGSTGDGYTFAADLGHTVEPVRPSLTPLVSSHPQIGYLDGLLLKNIRAVLYVDDEPVREEFGELGFSERGIEGAVALRMSRDAVDALIDERRVKLVVDLKPALTEEVLRERIAREIAGMEPTEFFAELLRKLVPKPLVMTLVHELGVNGKNYIGKLTEEEITRLIKTLKGFTFPITDYAPFEYAIVTAGGVSCAEVNPYTMESLKIRGLYFAGEVLDLDANTGGYNLQIAFSTGRLAGLLKK